MLTSCLTKTCFIVIVINQEKTIQGIEKFDKTGLKPTDTVVTAPNFPDKEGITLKTCCSFAYLVSSFISESTSCIYGLSGHIHCG